MFMDLLEIYDNFTLIFKDLIVHHRKWFYRRCVTLEECRSISAPVTPESTRKQMLVVDNMCRVDCPFGQEIG